jgi:misacylated tRNA(Ala) deacylase
MTILLCLEDAYMKEFDAVVVEVLEKGVVLDRTAFYPGGGGQPPDTGVLQANGSEWTVKKLSRVDGKTVHELEGDDFPTEGKKIHGLLDWERRYNLMRTHTALHVLCGVVWRDYGAHVTGGNMEPLKARMDFELESMSADFAREVEAAINKEVAKERPVHAHVQPRAEALKIPDLVRTKVNLIPESVTDIRTIDIEGLDLQADGGIHVANTREVGAIRVVKHESKGRINKRLRIALD